MSSVQSSTHCSSERELVFHILQRGSIHATQFHPEKSGMAGLDLLRCFLDPEAAAKATPAESDGERLWQTRWAPLAYASELACQDIATNASRAPC